MMSIRIHAALACATLAAGALAQNPEDAVRTPRAAEVLGSPTLAPQAPADAAARRGMRSGEELFTAPIRSGEDDNGYRYGTWGSGPDYKASFHDGFAFYPVLGDRYPHNLPLQWQTSSVRVGGEELLVAGRAPSAKASDWRYEYRFGAVTEAYDLRKDGVEQTFVLESRPAASGELLIEGRVSTELLAPERGFAHAALTFNHTDGTPIIGYGAATAVDAMGRRFPMDSAYADGTIRLRLAAGDLAAASFPLVVDPLLGNLIVSFDSTSRQASFPDVARDDAGNQLMTVYGRLNSGGDYDAFARITADDFTGTTLVWTDVTASWSTRRCDVAFVGGAGRWIVVIQRDFPSPTGSWIRYHTRASGDLVASSTYTALAGSSGNTLSAPDVGGTDAFSSGNNALVVYQSDVGLASSANSEVYAQLVDVAANTAGAPINLEVGATYDRETPSVNQVSDGGTASWICCWTQLDNAIAEDDWDLIIRRLDSAGVSQGRSFLGNASATVHAYVPKIAGRGGRYAACYGESPNPAGVQVNSWANEIWIQRFDWSEVSSTATTFDRVRVRAGGTADFFNGNIAYDNNTDSHFGLVYHSDAWDVFAAHSRECARSAQTLRVVDPAPQAPSPPIRRRRGGGRVSRPVRGRLDLPRQQEAARAYCGLGCGPMPALRARERIHRTGSQMLAGGRIRGHAEVERQIVSQPLRADQACSSAGPCRSSASRSSRSACTATSRWFSRLSSSSASSAAQAASFSTQACSARRNSGRRASGLPRRSLRSSPAAARSPRFASARIASIATSRSLPLAKASNSPRTSLPLLAARTRTPILRSAGSSRRPSSRRSQATNAWSFAAAASTGSSTRALPFAAAAAMRRNSGKSDGLRTSTQAPSRSSCAATQVATPARFTSASTRAAASACLRLQSSCAHAAASRRSWSFALARRASSSSLESLAPPSPRRALRRSIGVPVVRISTRMGFATSCLDALNAEIA
jgi:hypothetical protein